jgi:hypothetical protein
VPYQQLLVSMGLTCRTSSEIQEPGEIKLNLSYYNYCLWSESDILMPFEWCTTEEPSSGTLNSKRNTGFSPQPK